MSKKLKEYTLEEIFDIMIKYNTSCTACPLYPIQYFPCNHFCDRNIKDKKLIVSSIEEEVIIDE